MVKYDSKQLATWPNLFTFVRLVCIPIFLYLLFVLDLPLAAAWLLAALGSTDWFDGWLARKLDQVSSFGAVFDPSVDRLLLVVAAPAIFIHGAVPLWVAVLALLREVGVAAIAGWAWLSKSDVIAVTSAGKTGAFFLMFALPMFLGASTDASYASLLQILAWICVVPGLTFGYYSLVFDYLLRGMKKST